MPAPDGDTGSRHAAPRNSRTRLPAPGLQGADEILETLALEVEHPLAERGQAVVPTPRVVELGRGPVAGFDDHTFLDQPFERAVQGGRPQAHLAVSTLEDVLHDAVPVLFAPGERQQNVKPVAAERQKLLRIPVRHGICVSINIYMCQDNIARISRPTHNQRLPPSTVRNGSSIDQVFCSPGVVAKVRSLTDEPIQYVVLTHNHADHSGRAAKMMQIGATVIISRDDRQQLARGGQQALPQIAYARDGVLSLGGKDVQLKEYCGHTRGDTVADLPAARVVVVGDLATTPDTIPQIVNYGDGGNWTDLGRTLDAIAAMDFDFMVGGHGPVLTKQEFVQYRDKLTRLRERARALVKQGTSQEELTQTLLREFNWGTGPAAGNIPGMMVEFR